MAAALGVVSLLLVARNEAVFRLKPPGSGKVLMSDC